MRSGYVAYRPGGCVPACIATMLADAGLAHSLPTAPEAGSLDRLNEVLAEQASCFLLEIPRESLPWRSPADEWVAIIGTPGGVLHAVVACGEWVAWDPDPADALQPGDPLPEVVAGWLLLPYPRSIRLHRIEQAVELAEQGRVTIGCDA